MQVLLHILEKAWSLTGQMGPYLLFGFLMAGILHRFISPELVEKHLGKRGILQTWKATLLGVPLPLCSCSVIPVSASLRHHGAGKGATSAFLASTPQTGVDSVAATWGLLGPVFAAVRVIVAFVTGILAGTFVDLFDRDEEVKEHDEASCPNCSHEKKRLTDVWNYGFVSLPQDIGRALIIGMLIAGVLSAVAPEAFLAKYLQHPALTYLVITLFAIPLYVCATASIPVAMSLVYAGVSPGAALVFLIAGPATNAATIGTMWKTMGKKTVVIYLLTVISVAWLAGWIFDQMGIGMTVIDNVQHHAEGHTAWYNHIAGIALVFVLINALYKKYRSSCSCCEHDELDADHASGR